MWGAGRGAVISETSQALLATVALLSLSLAPAAHANEFKPVIGLSSLNGATGFRLDGPAIYIVSNRSVSGAGDVNGDGFADLIVGAYNENPNGENSGSTYVVFGRKSGFAASLNLSTLNGTNGFRLDGAAYWDESGRAASGAGDVNGDGYADLIVGALGAAPNGPNSGSTYVVFGKKAGFAASLNLSALNGSDGFRLDGANQEVSGFSVSGAGDVNGDGFADVIVGAIAAASNGPDSGSSYVVFGKKAGFAASLNLSALNGSNGFRLDGVAVGDLSGLSVSSAGDVNGDGFADLIIGTVNAGASYVVFGKKAGFTASFKLSALDGANGFRLDGAAGDDIGSSVSAAGDVNGDGFADLIIGASGARPSGEDSGSSYVVFGRNSSFAATLTLSSLNGTNGFRIDGAWPLDRSGSSVSAAGDVNGDGFADVIVGAPTAGWNGELSGSSYVVFGRKSGFAATLALSSLNGRNGFRLDGAIAEYSGLPVSGAGDVNGDGFADLIVGAPKANPTGSDSSSSYVVFGRAPDSGRIRNGWVADQYISGGNFADTLSGADGRDELEGRGAGDILIGGNGLESASYRHAPEGVIADLALPAKNTGVAKGDSYDSIEALRGSSFSDTLLGDAKANVIIGDGGADTLRGRGGNDIFRFEKVSDSKAGLKHDVIADFNPGTATAFVDRIDLSAIDAKPRVGGNQAFIYRGSLPFTGAAGEIRIKLSGGNAIVEGNITKDTVADFEIELSNLSSLANLDSTDFIR